MRKSMKYLENTSRQCNIYTYIYIYDAAKAVLRVNLQEHSYTLRNKKILKLKKICYLMKSYVFT